MTRYSNNSAMLDDLRYARQAAMTPGEDDEPELGGERRAHAQDRWAGMIVRDLAEELSMSPSSVKRVLRRAGARKRRKPPG